MTPADNLEKKIRFGCGFIFGLIVGGINLVYFFRDSGYGAVATVIILALVCALLALRYGDAFWRWIANWGFWF